VAALAQACTDIPPHVAVFSSQQLVLQFAGVPAAEFPQYCAFFLYPTEHTDAKAALQVPEHVALAVQQSMLAVVKVVPAFDVSQ
jgi:hypothetical protein